MIHPMFRTHRERLLSGLGTGYALFIAPPQQYRSNDSEHRYRQSSTLWWLSGWEWADAALLLRPGTEQPFILFVQPRNPETEIWTGPRPGLEGAQERFHADVAYPFHDLAEKLPELLQGALALHYTLGDQPDMDALVVGAIRKARRQAYRNGLEVPNAIIDPASLIHEMRLIKDDDEIAFLRRAAAISAEAHIVAMTTTRAGMFEYEVEANVDATFRRRGARSPSFPTIVGAGPHAASLHYVDNDTAIREGDLVLLDAGCEYEFYAGDITRTFPVDGRFTEAQRQVYEIVLATQEACIAAIRPGALVQDVYDLATRMLTEGMVALGLLEGSVETLIQTGASKKYYPHRAGHWLGIDVHDVGRYHVGGQSRPFEPGMLLTVEPGLYIPADDTAAPEHLRGIGVRIEDDILVTADGNEVLSGAVPKTVADIEALMAKRV